MNRRTGSNESLSRYESSGVRYESRPDPVSAAGRVYASIERDFRTAGVQARWISVVDPWGVPYYRSRWLPTTFTDIDEQETQLRRLIQRARRTGAAVLSWYPLSLNKAAVQVHPDWAQQMLVDMANPGVHRGIECCIHSGYGAALIEFACEAIERFGLDGFWFDGSAWTQIWERPVPLSCVCRHCRELYRRQTGHDLPTQVDWADDGFRRWVGWRYEAFGGYIGRLTQQIHRRHPHASVVINHYHRPQIPWQSAVPIDLYDAPIVTGSEATGDAGVDLVMRLCRAYQRPHCEVWTPLTIGPDPKQDAETTELIHHAAACITAGGFPSYGGAYSSSAADVLARISPWVNPLVRYVGGASLSHVAIHVSQQSETYFYSRHPKGVNWETEPYWLTINGWTQALNAMHMPPDYLFDACLIESEMARYRVLILPASPALSDAQCAALYRYVQQGGRVILGPGAGSCDEWGNRRTTNPLEQRFGFGYTHTSQPEMPTSGIWAFAPMDSSVRRTIASPGGVLSASPPWRVLAMDADTRAPLIVHRSWGEGSVSVCGMAPMAEMTRWYRMQDRVTAVEHIPHGGPDGTHALELRDGPNAQESFFPDLEITVQTMRPPFYRSAGMRVWLRLESDSLCAMELRSRAPALGPALTLHGGGRIRLGDHDVGTAPAGVWLRVELQLGLGPESTAEVRITTHEGGAVGYARVPISGQGLDRCDWAVIYSPGEAPGAFRVADLEIYGVGPNGKDAVILTDRFLSHRSGRTSDCDAAQAVVSALRIEPHPWIRVEAPPSVRAGLFRMDAGVVVHLHDTHGGQHDVPADHSVRLVCTRPVLQVIDVRTQQPVAVQRANRGWVVTAPRFAVHTALILRGV